MRRRRPAHNRMTKAQRYQQRIRDSSMTGSPGELSSAVVHGPGGVWPGHGGGPVCDWRRGGHRWWSGSAGGQLRGGPGVLRLARLRGSHRGVCAVEGADALKPGISPGPLLGVGVAGPDEVAADMPNTTGCRPRRCCPVPGRRRRNRRTAAAAWPSGRGRWWCRCQLLSHPRRGRPTGSPNATVTQPLTLTCRPIDIYVTLHARHISGRSNFSVHTLDGIAQ